MAVVAREYELESRNAVPERDRERTRERGNKREREPKKGKGRENEARDKRISEREMKEEQERHGGTVGWRGQSDTNTITWSIADRMSLAN